MKKVFLEQFSRIGKALSNPARLALLDLLCQSEKSVETLVAQSGMTLKNASAQLKALKEAGLVKTRRDGKYVFYSISHPDLSEFWLLLQKFGSGQIRELQLIARELVHTKETLTGVNRAELMKKAKSEDVIIIDVRPGDEYESAHLPYAISIPVSELSKKLKTLPKNKEIIAYCRGPFCLLSQEAVEYLQKKGYTAYRLDDGVQDWKSAGLSVVESKNIS